VELERGASTSEERGGNDKGGEKERVSTSTTREGRKDERTVAAD
jgi:hypothetical protein